MAPTARLLSTDPATGKLVVSPNISYQKKTNGNGQAALKAEFNYDDDQWKQFIGIEKGVHEELSDLYDPWRDPRVTWTGVPRTIIREGVEKLVNQLVVFDPLFTTRAGEEKLIEALVYRLYSHKVQTTESQQKSRKRPRSEALQASKSDDGISDSEDTVIQQALPTVEDDSQLQTRRQVRPSRSTQKPQLKEQSRVLQALPVQIPIRSTPPLPNTDLSHTLLSSTAQREPVLGGEYVSRQGQGQDRSSHSWRSFQDATDNMRAIAQEFEGFSKAYQDQELEIQQLREKNNRLSGELNKVKQDLQTEKAKSANAVKALGFNFSA